MFENSFWSHDYTTGVDALIAALKLSIVENKQFIDVVQQRAHLEHQQAANLAQLSQSPSMHPTPDPVSTPNKQIGSPNAKPSSLQVAISSLASDTVDEAVIHTRMASDLELQIVSPLKKWCSMYQQRVNGCSTQLKRQVDQYAKLHQAVTKQRQYYYEQCRKFEDSAVGGSPKDPFIKTIRILRDKFENVDFWQSSTGPADASGASTSTSSSNTSEHTGNTISSNSTSTLTPQAPQFLPKYHIAGLNYDKDELSQLLDALLSNMSLMEYKVPLLGSYQSVCTGSMLATAARKRLQNDSFAYAEKFGQSLVDLGFIKPVGQISNRFQSTHNSHYQWQPLAFALAKQVDAPSASANTTLDSNASLSSEATGHSRGSQNKGSVIMKHSNGSRNSVASRNSIASSSASVNTTDSESETTTGATDDSEEDYLQAVLQLEDFRCIMEVEIDSMYRFLGKLELDRNIALKKAMRDYIRITFSLNDRPLLEHKLKTHDENVDPEGDVELMIRKHQTGPYAPAVTVFEGFFSPSPVQTYGVDLSLSAFFMPLILEYLDEYHPTQALEIWTKRENLSDIFKVRNQINTGKVFNTETTFKFFTLSMIVSALGQYLLELPESLVSFVVYERFKQLYTNAPHLEADVIASVLVQVPQRSCESLELIIKYLAKKFPTKEEQVQLANAMSFLLVRPRAPSAVNMDDGHPALLILDLLQQNQEVFSSLKKKQAEMHENKDRQTPVRQITPLTPQFNRRTPQLSPSLHSVASPPHLQQQDGSQQSPVQRVSSSANRGRPLSLSFRSPSTRPDESVPVRSHGIQPILPLAKTQQQQPSQNLNIPKRRS